jgi:nitrogen fixation NifU-like protein
VASDAGERVREAPPYLALVVEHYRRPRNQRSLTAPTHSYEGANALCGDRLRMELQVCDGALADVAFQASACAIATASASLLTERVRGAALSEVARLSDDEIVAALGAGVPAARRGCATLALRVLRRALDAGA